MRVEVKRVTVQRGRNKPRQIMVEYRPSKDKNKTKRFENRLETVWNQIWKPAT